MRGIVVGLVAILLVTGDRAYSAEPARASVFTTQAVRRFGDLSISGVFLGYPLRWNERDYGGGTLSSWLDVSVGHLTETDRRGSLVSVGPSFEYRRDAFGNRWILEAGTAFTWIDHERFSRGEIGGHFHFTTHLSAGSALGGGTLRIRMQHTSNGGSDTPNPGIDMLGLEYVVDLE